jgi:selenocysteine lyase/cysteine desulfurase
MFSHHSHSNKEIMDALSAANVFAAERNGKIRFAPHLYNTDEEIAEAVDALP